MARIYNLALTGLTSVLMSSFAVGQGAVDIGLFHDQGNLNVKVRPASDFDGVFSSAVFTLRWDRNSDITLGDATVPDGTPINTRKSGQLRQDGMFNYLVFAGFGFETMASSGSRWVAGEEYTILSIPVSGTGVVELVNDQWTGTITNNGDYYVSLGGHDKTGVIYKSLATTADLESTVSIKPNPNEGLFQFSFSSEEPVDIRVEVLNTLGQSTFTENLRGFQGTYMKNMDLTAMSEGIYYLKLTRGSTTSVHKIAYR